MCRFAAAVLECGLLVGLCSAQDPKPDAPKWEPPPTPEGWKAVTSKDGAYLFAFPGTAPRTGTRDRNYTVRGVRERLQVNYCVLKDGTMLEVNAAILTGPGVKGVTVAEVIDGMIDAEKDDGFEVSAPKKVKIGEVEGREYRLVKDKLSRRTVFFFARPRLFLLNVAAEDPAKLDTETADTFLKSMALVPAEILKARAEERAAKNAQTAKEQQEKYGAKWTLALADMTAPDAPAVGVIRGKEFKPESVTFRGSRLVFRQGVKGAFADVEATLTLSLKGESIENKTYEIKAATANPVGSPVVRLATMTADGAVPQGETFMNKYALKLTFGAKDADGNVPGTIYLCASDTGKSFLAGKFTVKGK
jgi:hypothetical protein